MTRMFGILILLAVLATPANALDGDTRALLEADISSEEKNLIAQAMRFGPQDAATFWPIYDEYRLKVAELDKVRQETLNEYTLLQQNLSPQMAETYLEQFLHIETTETRLRTELSKKLSEEFTPIIAARFYHVERELALIYAVHRTEDYSLLR